MKKINKRMILKKKKRYRKNRRILMTISRLYIVFKGTRAALLSITAATNSCVSK